MPDGRFMVNYQTIKWILSDEVNEYGIRPVKHIGNSYAIAFIEPDGLLLHELYWTRLTSVCTIC